MNESGAGVVLIDLVARIGTSVSADEIETDLRRGLLRVEDQFAFRTRCPAGRTVPSPGSKRASSFARRIHFADKVRFTTRFNDHRSKKNEPLKLNVAATGQSCRGSPGERAVDRAENHLLIAKRVLR